MSIPTPQLRLDLPSRMHSFYGWSGPLGGTGLPEKVAFVRQVMAQKGYNKPVFVGEVALKCTDGTAECYDAAAAFVPRVYAEAYRLGVTGQVYYLLIADIVHYSLMTSDFAARPMYESYEVVSNYLRNSRYEGSGHRISWRLWFSVQSKWHAAISDCVVDGLAPIKRFRHPADFIRAADKFGQPIEPVNGQLTIGWSPLYLEMQ